MDSQDVEMNNAQRFRSYPLLFCLEQKMLIVRGERSQYLYRFININFIMKYIVMCKVNIDVVGIK